MGAGELLLHVGTHKTGTTSFQEFLPANEAALAARGVLALADPVLNEDRPEDRFNVKIMAHHFIRPDLVTPARVNAVAPLRSGADRRAYEDALIKLIKDSSCNKVVGSAEALCFLRQELEDMDRFLDRITRRARFFVVFREQADWRRSWLEQTNRTPMLVNALRSGLPEHERVTADWYFDKAAIRHFWSRLGDLVELDYDDHADIRVGLAEKMGIDTRDLAFGPWENVSPRV